MEANWDTATLSDVAFVTDFSANGSFADLRENVEYLSKPDYAVLVRLVDFSRNWDGDFVYIPKHSYDFLRKCQLEVGDVIIANIGANAGTLFRVPDLKQPSALGPNALVIKTDNFPDTSKEFLYYYFTSSDGQNQVQSIITGSAQPKFTKTDLRNLKIPFPSITEQRAIASILGALDDKIELNHRMNRTLENMAKAVFRQWFMENEEVGDWEVGILGDFIEVNERSINKDYSKYEIEYIDISSVSVGHLEGTTLYDLKDAPSRARRLVQHGDTIWSTVRPNRKSYLFISNPKENLVVSTGFAVLTPKRIPPSLLYFFTTSEQFVDYLVSNADGSAYPAVLADRFADAEFPIPPDGLADKFENFANPILAQIAHNEKESRTLANLRDSLLPKLMKGEVRVRDL